jgi:adenylate cyclase
MPTSPKPGHAPPIGRVSWHTFLFADLVGFTALADVEGDDRALEVALGLQRRARRLLVGPGAEQVKAIGDGLMLRFTDPQAAVVLGVRLVGELASDADFPLVRVGIHTGPALSSDGDWYGRTVNIAERLCSIAPAGGVLISDLTREAAGRIDGVRWSSPELRWLRNVSAPIGTFLVNAHEQPVRSPRRKAAAPLSFAWFGPRAAGEMTA